MKRVAILGGGPAGAFAAEQLASAGLRVVVFDEKLAWEKPCGGGLTFKGQMFAEISRIATEIAKRKGATLLLDKAGPSMMGVSNILYYDPSLEITDEVIAAANRDRPATVPAG